MLKERVQRMAPLLHRLAAEYSTDPYTIWTEWDLGRLDFNTFVLKVALEEEARALERERRRMQR